MAKKILVATLYQHTETNTCLLYVSPALLKIKCGDQVFIIVQLDSSVKHNGNEIQCRIAWADRSTKGPFGSELQYPKELDTPTLLGTISDEAKRNHPYSYTLTVKYDGNTYSEDPEMELKG